MKRSVIACLITLALVMPLAQGCVKENSKQPDQTAGQEQPAVKKQVLLIGVEGITGDYYIGSGIAAILNKHLDYLDVQCKAVSDQTDYIQKLARGEFHLGILSSGLAAQAGLKVYMVTPLYTKGFQCVVKKNSGLREINDIKGRKVAVGPINSEGEKLTRAILAACDITYNNFTPFYYSSSEAAKEYAKGNLDCIIVNDKLPSSTVAELSANYDNTILVVDNNNIDKIIRKLPFYEGITIVPHTYIGLEEYIPTACTTSYLAGSEGLDRETVYAVTRIIYENLSELKSFHPLGKELKSGYENSIQQPLTFHPGAIQYFVEQQIIRPETTVQKK